MDIHTNIPLKNFTTMRLGGAARFMAEAHTTDDLIALLRNAKQQNLPVFILGGGSNVIARDEGYVGLVIRIRIPGFTIINDDINTTTIKSGAGEDWDSFVKKTVDMHLTGIETMSMIPGTVGASPVQNIGAYGQEVSETIVEVEAYDRETDQLVTLDNAACGFAYRHSHFRGDFQGRYVITAVTFRLSKNQPAPPFYKDVEAYFATHGITLFTHQTLRDAVMAIRSEKLPDPKIVANSGSFFKNAIVDNWRLDELRQQNPDIVTYDMGNGTTKIPTGWLIEKVGYKGKQLHGMKVHDKNALVLINESATSYADLAAAREEISGAVRDHFQILLEQEPLELI